ncbi:hypothetical protein GA0115234_103320 [Streptomyces sp. DvalAA-43]|nr:hypothetical protein GA0115234_103320 [Streptomyces sp. DvalAA-43]
MEIFLLLAVGAAAKHTTDSVRGWLARRDQKAQDDMAAHEATVQEIAAGNYPGSPDKKGNIDQKSTGNNSAGGKGKHHTLPASNPSGPAPKDDGKKERKDSAKAARKAAQEESKARKKAARDEARSRSSAGRAGAPGRSGAPGGGMGRAPVGADTKGPRKPGPGKGGGAGSSGKDGKGAAGSGGGKGAAGGSGAGTPAGKDDTAVKDKAARQAEKDAAAKDKTARADKKKADKEADHADHADRLERRKERSRKAGAATGRAARKTLDARRDRAARKKAKKEAADRAKDSKNTTTDPADPAGPGGTFAGDKAKHAGTRAGTRAGRAIQSARAYGEGFLEGFKAAMDQAAREHAAAQAQAELDRTRKPMTDAAPATPVPVTAEDSKTGLLTLGKGATRKTISRGEVKTLKNFTDRLGDYASTASSAADDCKALTGQAQEYAAQATALAEECQAVKGGEGLVGECLALAEAATVQGGAADELHARMLRAVESLETTSANAGTRHGAIFRAVADSPLSSPAESRFYNS